MTDSLTLTFPIELSGDRARPVVSFFNGDERVSSTGSTWEGDSLIVNFDHLMSQLRATVSNGVLRGTYGNTRRATRRTSKRDRNPAEKSGERDRAQH